MRFSIFILTALSGAAAFIAPRSISRPTRSYLQSTVASSPLSPATIWGDPLQDVSASQAAARSKVSAFPATVERSEALADGQTEMEYFRDNAAAIKDAMIQR